MSDEPTRRIPPASDPTQIQPPPPHPQHDASSSYAATQRLDAITHGQDGQTAGILPEDPEHPPSNAPTQVLPPARIPAAPRDYRASVPPPAWPDRPYVPQTTPVRETSTYPTEPTYGQNTGQYPGTSPLGHQPSAPEAQNTPPHTPPPGQEHEGHPVAGAFLAWIPRILLALSIYQLIRLIPGFDTMPDASRFPLFRWIGDSTLAVLHLNPDWSDQAAILTIPLLGIALAGLWNTIRSLKTSLAIWPHILVIIAWILVFVVVGIIDYAHTATENMRQNVQETVNQEIEDAQQNAKESVQQRIEQGVEDAKQDASTNINEQLDNALPGGNE